MGAGLSRTQAAISTYLDFATTSANHGFSASTNYTPNSTPLSTTLVDVNGSDTGLNYVSVYGGSLTSASNDALAIGTLVFDSVSTNTSYIFRSQSTSSTTATTAEFDATLTLSGGDAGTTAGTTLNGTTTVAVPQTAANDLLVLTSNLGGKTISLTGYGAADPAITTAGTGNISVAGINGDNLIVAVPNSGNFDIATGNELNFSNTTVTSGGSKTYTATISGAGTIGVTGGGTLRFANSNSNFTGGFNVSGGSTLLIPGGNGPDLGATPTSSSPPQVTLNGGQFEISSSFGTTPLGVARQIGLTAGGGVNSMNQSSGYTAIAGQISGGGGFVKTGAGTTILASGVNSYTGTTEVAQGALLVDGTNATSSVTTVDNGATLGGTGTTSSVNTSNGSVISPGEPNSYTSSSATGFTATSAGAATPIGTLTINGNLNIAAGAIFNFDIASPSSGDLISVLGTTTGGGAVFNLYVPGTTTALDAAGVYNLIAQAGGFTGDYSGDSIGDLPSDMTAAFGVGSNGDLQVTYTQVPEPVAAALLAATAALPLLGRRRRPPV
jgi:autotransporter-associated beta strand protein